MATISTENYIISGIDLYFDASPAHGSLVATLLTMATPGGNFRTSGRNLGNIVTAELAPDITYVEHFISVLGAMVRDKAAINRKALTIPFTFDEMNEANLKKFMVASTISTNKLAPLTLVASVLEGSVSLMVRTEVGKSLVYSIPKALLRTSGNLPFTTDSWWQGNMTIDVMYYAGTDHWASKPYGVIHTNVDAGN